MMTSQSSHLCSRIVILGGAIGLCIPDLLGNLHSRTPESVY